MSMLSHAHRLLDFLKLPAEFEDVIVRSSCLGGYRTRLLVGSIWPLALVIVFTAGFICWEAVVQGCSKGRRISFTSHDVFAVVQKGLQRGLPLLLAATFILVPSVSTRIFKTFLW